MSKREELERREREEWDLRCEKKRNQLLAEIAVNAFKTECWWTKLARATRAIEKLRAKIARAKRTLKQMDDEGS